LLLNVLVSACTITAVLLFWSELTLRFQEVDSLQAFGFLHRATATRLKRHLTNPPWPTPTEEYIVYQVIFRRHIRKHR